MTEPTEPAERIDDPDKTATKYFAAQRITRNGTKEIAVPRAFLNRGFRAVSGQEFGDVSSAGPETLQFGAGIAPQLSAISSHNARAYANHTDITTYHHCWWFIRDLARLIGGEWEPLPTTVLSNMQQVAAINYSHALHISKRADSDELMVAYNASLEDAKRDVQRRVSFGRYLRKEFIHLQDQTIQFLEANLRAYYNMRLVLVNESFEAMLEAYQIHSACMSKNTRDYGITSDEYHPLRCYDPTLGWAVAVAQDGNQKDVARATVWINPDNPSDKRWARMYGDGVISGLLGREGFVNKAFDGAKLRTIPYPDKPGFIILPYVDGSAQNGNPDNKFFFVEPDTCTFLPAAEYRNLKAKASKALSTIEWRSAHVFAAAKIYNSVYTCGVCANERNENKHTRVTNPVLKIDICSDCVEQGKAVYAMHCGANHLFPVDRTVGMDSTIFHNNLDNFEYYGIYQLSAKFYTEEQGLQRHVSGIVGAIDLDCPSAEINIIHIKNDDSVPWIHVKPESGLTAETRIHKNQFAPIKKQTIKLYGGRYMFADHAGLTADSVSGRKMLKTELALRADGKYDFPRNTHACRAFLSTHTFEKREGGHVHVPDPAESETMLAEMRSLIRIEQEAYYSPMAELNSAGKVNRNMGYVVYDNSRLEAMKVKIAHNENIVESLRINGSLDNTYANSQSFKNQLAWAKLLVQEWMAAKFPVAAPPPTPVVEPLDIMATPVQTTGNATTMMVNVNALLTEMADAVASMPAEQFVSED